LYQHAPATGGYTYAPEASIWQISEERTTSSPPRALASAKPYINYPLFFWISLLSFFEFN
jgi:hypothetical protein